MTIFSGVSEKFVKIPGFFKRYAGLSGLLKLYRDVNKYFDDLQKPYKTSIVEVMSYVDKKTGSLFVTDLLVMSASVAAGITFVSGAAMLIDVALATVPVVLAVPAYIGISAVAGAALYVISEASKIALHKNAYQERSNRFANDSLKSEESAENDKALNSKPSTIFSWVQNLLPEFIMADFKAFIEGLKPDEITDTRKYFHGVSMLGVKGWTRGISSPSFAGIAFVGVIGESIYLNKQASSIVFQYETRAKTLPLQVESMKVSKEELEVLTSVIGTKWDEFKQICNDANSSLAISLDSSNFDLSRKAITSFQSQLGKLSIDNIIKLQPIARINDCVSDIGGLGIPAGVPTKDVKMSDNQVSLVKKMIVVFDDIKNHINSLKSQSTVCSSLTM